jgi:hypothetical protein
MPVGPRILGRLALGLVLLGSAGCRRKQPENTEATPTIVRDPVAAAPAELRGQLAKLGDRGVAVLAVRDAGWAEGPSMILEALGERASSPEWLLRELAKTIDLPVPPTPLAGRDTSRAILASLGEAPVDGVVTFATVSQPLREASQAGMRHQMLIPAKDTAALGDSVAAWFVELEAWPELVAGRERARAWRTDDGFVAALPEADAVRVIVVHGVAGIDRISELPRWQAQLDSVAVEPEDSPALRQFGQPDTSAALFVRPWRMRGYFTWWGLYEGRSALSDAPIAYREQAVARATAIVLGSEVMMSDDNPELDDWALSLGRTDGALRLRAVANLTELGQQRLAAARSESAAPLTIAATDLIADSWVTIDASALLAEARGPGVLAELSIDEALELWRNCGIGCPLHAALRAPVGSLRGLFEGQDPAMVKLLSSRTTVVGAQFVELTPAADGRERRALALLLRPGDELGATLVASSLGDAIGRDGQVSAGQRGDTPLLLFGQGVDPAEVFDLDAPAVASSALAEARFDLATLFAAPAADPRLAQTFATLSGRVRGAETALAFELVLADKDSLSFTPEFAGMRWSSPMRAAPASPGDVCLQRAGLAVTQALHARADMRSQDWATSNGATLERIEPDLRCAAEHEPTAAAAAGLRRMLIEAAVPIDRGPADP